MALLRATYLPLMLIAAILLASVAVQGDESATNNRNLLAADHHNFKHAFTKAHMHSSRHGAVYHIHAYTKGRTHDKLGHTGRKLKSLVTASQEATAVAPEQAEHAEGKGRSLLKADTAESTNHGGYGYGGNPWSTQLIPHGDHMDRVAVFDSTRASSRENYNHYGGWGRKLMSLVMGASDKPTPADNAAAAPKQVEGVVQEPTADTTVPAPEHQSAEPAPADNTEQAEGKGRSLLKADTAASTNHDDYGYGGYGGNPWSTELIPHGDHMDRVAVYDSTRASSWENYNHYGRKLAQAATQDSTEDAASNTVEPEAAAQPGRALLASTNYGGHSHYNNYHGHNSYHRYGGYHGNSYHGHNSYHGGNYGHGHSHGWGR